jgi:formylglycine-generating enzyme required for sulfatase activity
MRRIAGGAFRMGSERHYPEEAPVRTVTVGPFWIDETPVTNAAFAQFVDATGYVTLAETAPSLDDYPDADPALLKPGSAVFVPTSGPVDLNEASHWWAYVVGACWRTPFGPGSDLEGLSDHPVAHVCAADAEAYAAWAGKALPTEAEWEFAARGGLDGAAYAWGEALAPGGAMLANYWQGRFPWENRLDDGYLRTSPVRAFPANGYGLYDMIGNVWEWTADAFRSLAGPTVSPCCAAGRPEPAMPKRVIKGGSHLCAENYCQRYRPAARHDEAIDSATGHLGFRCVVR